MTSENVADRLLNDARKKTAKQDSPTLGKIALIVGALALLSSPVPIVAWILGATAVGLGVASVRRPAAATMAKIAIGLGVAAILVGVFFFTLAISQGW
jgi:hypothetical protein